MTLRGCMKCFKYSVFLLNFVIWLSGLLTLAMAIYLRMDPNLNHMIAVGYTQHLSAYHFFCYFLMFFGAAVTFLGFLGCCSSYQESYTMLGFFLGILVLFLIAEAGMASWLVMQKNNMKHSVEESMKEYLHKTYNVDFFSNDPIDQIQENFKCCGGTGPKDYFFSDWFNSTQGAGCPKSGGFTVPASCCLGRSRKQHASCIADGTRKFHCHGDKVEVERAKSRRTAVEKSAKNSTAAYNQLLSLILSLCLCCGLRRRSAGGYKS